MRWNGAPQVVDRLAWALTSTWTYHVFGGDHVRAACRASPTGRVMFILWHQDLLLFSGAIRGQGMRLAALVSRSGDGALIAVHLERRGVRTVRGSSRRGAAAAAKELLEAAKAGFHPAIAIDGPKGPALQTRTGPLEIARLSGLPVVPMAACATGEIRLPTWDRMRISPPRAHIALQFGPAMILPDHEPDERTLEGRRRDLAIRLHGLSLAAAANCRRRDRIPAARHLAWLHAPGADA